MKLKTASLIGPALFWAVMECEFRRMQKNGTYVEPWVLEQHVQGKARKIDGSEAMTIIDRERISLREFSPVRDDWEAEIRLHHINVFGPNPLVAALRCYAVTELGDEIEIPDVLAADAELEAYWAFKGLTEFEVEFVGKNGTPASTRIKVGTEHEARKSVAARRDCDAIIAVQKLSGTVGKHDWFIGNKCGDGYPVFVDDRQLSYRATSELARDLALRIIANLQADGDYRLNDRPSGFLPPEQE